MALFEMPRHRRTTPPPRAVRSGIVAGLILILLLAFLSSTWFTVEADEMGVVTRFGRFDRTEEPGLHFKWPWGIEQVQRVTVKRVQKEEFGFRTEAVAREGRTRYTGTLFDQESLMLTGDLNVADVEWIVQYQIGDPYLYLVKIRDVVVSLRDISHSVMREVVGDRSVDEVLTEGRREINLEVERQMQEILDRYESGIRILRVELQDVNPPEKVKPSFNEVNAAKQEQERLINEARREYNEVIPKSRGVGDQVVSQAEGYALDRVNRARGDAEKFKAILAEYLKAPDVTRRRYFLETMREVLPSIRRKIIIDSDTAIPPLPLLQIEGGDS
ncbi:MAG: FtsH protease activity modulator HflK [Planctomycetota bacterium]